MHIAITIRNANAPSRVMWWLINLNCTHAFSRMNVDRWISSFRNLIVWMCFGTRIIWFLGIISMPTKMKLPWNPHNNKMKHVCRETEDAQTYLWLNSSQFGSKNISIDLYGKLDASSLYHRSSHSLQSYRHSLSLSPIMVWWTSVINLIIC